MHPGHLTTAFSSASRAQGRPRAPHCPEDTASHQSAPGAQPRRVGPKVALGTFQKATPNLLNDPENSAIEQALSSLPPRASSRHCVHAFRLICVPGSGLRNEVPAGCWRMALGPPSAPPPLVGPAPRACLQWYLGQASAK